MTEALTFLINDWKEYTKETGTSLYDFLVDDLNYSHFEAKEIVKIYEGENDDK